MRFKTVKRTRLKTLPGFEPEEVELSITGVVFCWQGNDLFRALMKNGVSDVEKMEVLEKNRNFRILSVSPQRFSMKESGTKGRLKPGTDFVTE